MATSNTYNATFGGHPFTLAFNWSLASQSIPGNYSTISWNLQVIKTGSYTPYNNTSSPTWATNITSGNWGPYNFNGAIGQTITIASGSYNIGHASDGTGSISVSFNANAISTITTASGSGSDTLPTIARATVPTVSPTSGNFGTAYTITVNPASSSFYHNIDYSLDGGTTWTNIVTNLAGTTTTQNWTPAATLLPNAIDVTAIIRATTLTGSGGSTIGTNNVSLPLHVDNTIIPTISSVAWVDTQTSAPDIPTLMGGTGRYVQGWSKLQPTVTSAGASGSTITSSTVTQGGQVTASGTAFTNPVTLSGAAPYSAIATDSRLRTSAAYTNTVAVTAYAFPSLPAPTIQRTSDAAGLIPSPTGSYLRITPSASVSDLTFGGAQKNTIEYQIRIKPTGGSFTTVTAWTSTGTSGVTWTTPVVVSGYASTTEWQVEVSLRDKFGNLGYNTGSTVVVQNVVVPTESVFMDWDGNAGIGIGKYHTNGQLDLSGQIYQNSGNLVPDMSSTFVASGAETSALALTSKLVTPGGLLSALITANLASQNLIINGSFRTNQRNYASAASLPIGTYCVDRWKASGVTNIVQNGRYGSAGTTTTGWTLNANGSAVVESGSSTGGPTTDCPSYHRYAFSTIGTTLKVLTYGSTTASPITPGKIYSASVWVRSSVTLSGAYMDANTVTSGGAVVTDGPNSAFSLPANTWVLFNLGSFVCDTAATWANLRLVLPAALPSALNLDVTGLMLTEGYALYPYFDGAATDCAWSGTAFASSSYNVPNVVPTLTFTADPNFGQTVTLNTNARLSQIVERSRMPAGTFTITHSGTAQMRVYKNLTVPSARPAFQAAPFSFTADGLDDVVVEFSGGGSGATISQVRGYVGSSDFGFALPNVGDEILACQRYYFGIEAPQADYAVIGPAVGSASAIWARTLVRWPVRMRVVPAVTLNGLVAYDGGTVWTTTAGTCNDGVTIDGMAGDINTTGAVGQGKALSVLVTTVGVGYFRADAELR